MVNELRELLSDNAASPPAESHDLSAVIRAGRRRVRRRRLAVVGGTAASTAVVVGTATLVWPGGSPSFEAAGVPEPDAPTMRLSDARDAVEGKDYRVLSSYTNDDLDRDNGQYFDGVTDDGLVLFRDGPRMEQLYPRYALLDPDTGAKDWLPQLKGLGQKTVGPVELSEDRLVLATMWSRPVAYVFDRASREWTEHTWPELPKGTNVVGMGPDDRLYLRKPATRGQPPEGGWPSVDGEEVDDSDAEGDTFSLWSVSLTDPTDVRDERLRVGDVAFTDGAMVWTDATNGDSGRIHVRDLASGEVASFDPRSGEKCNLLSFGASGEHIMLGQYCGDYKATGGVVRDDRVQVVTTDGEQVVTLQDDGVEGALTDGGDVVTVTSYHRGRGGTFVYDLASERFLRLSDSTSSYAAGGGPTPTDQFLWSTPVNRNKGATQWLGEMVRD